MIKLTQILKEIKISSHNGPRNWLDLNNQNNRFGSGKDYELNYQEILNFILNKKVYNLIRKKYNLNLNDEELKQKLEDYIENEASEVHEDPDKMKMWSNFSLNNIINFFENYLDF